MTNKIRRYFESGPGKYNGSAYDAFKRKIADGESLRNLCRFLEGTGLKVSPSTVSKYIDTLEIEYKQQRKVEKIGKKLRRLFHKSELPFKVDCKHEFTESFFSIADERVYTKCTKCKKVLGSADPQDKSRNHREKTLTLLEALSK